MGNRIGYIHDTWDFNANLQKPLDGNSDTLIELDGAETWWQVSGL